MQKLQDNVKERFGSEFACDMWCYRNVF